jgi:hypothetical protein
MKELVKQYEHRTDEGCSAISLSGMGGSEDDAGRSGTSDIQRPAEAEEDQDMKCEYCNIRSENDKPKRGKELTRMNGISVYLWGSKTIEIDTDIDGKFAFIRIKYCPMCGREL